MRPATLVCALPCLALALIACPSPPASVQEVSDSDDFEDTDSSVIPFDGDSGPTDIGPEVEPSEVGDGEVDGGCDSADDCRVDDLCHQADCDAGRCVQLAVVCSDDDNPCTDVLCKPAQGCVQVPNLRACDDGVGCTVDDRCSGGSCHGRELDCDDFEVCTDDFCEEGKGCQHDPHIGACDDADACTVDDACQDGACVGAPRVCPVPPGSHGCSIAECDARDGCSVRFGNGPCDDDDLCTSDTACHEGACVGTLLACDDGDACTDDLCDPAKGCTTTFNHAPCSDGDGCTGPDRCEAGECKSGDVTACCHGPDDCDDGDACTTDRCETGNCLHDPTCDDGDPCTFDTCDAGVCDAVASPVVPDEAGGGLLLEGFEGALDARWDLTSDNPMVGWQRDGQWSSDGVWSLYVGKVPDYSYDFGATRAVATWRGPIPRDAATLVVTVKSAVDETSCSYDALVVMLDDEALAPAVCGSNGAGVERRWDIASAAGRTAELSFVFDTVDDESNAGQGVWIDGLRVEREGPALCCDDAADCAPDAGGACGEPSCTSRRCGLDTSGCP